MGKGAWRLLLGDETRVTARLEWGPRGLPLAAGGRRQQLRGDVMGIDPVLVTCSPSHLGRHLSDRALGQGKLLCSLFLIWQHTSMVGLVRFS